MRIPPHFSQTDLERYQRQTHLVLKEIEANRDELQDEFGNFTTMDLPTGRVLLIPEATPDEDDWFVCYLHDASADARLVVDDYVPELADSSDPEMIPVEEIEE